MRYRSIASVACLLLAACASTLVSAGEQGPPRGGEVVPLDPLPALRGDYFVVESTRLGRQFHIYVRLPADMAETPGARYPVVYLLDGDSLFPHLASNHLFLTYDDALPEAIVVGIAYGGFEPAVNRRGYDFSAPAEDARADQGGADAFLDFLRTELLPEVERRYPADPGKRVLFGQSRGGHFVLYSAFVDPDLFWGRIASNPTLQPGRARFFQPAAPASRDDLVLVFTSSEHDWPDLRASALDWAHDWRARTDAPWAIHFATVPGGTHAADSARSYRIGMNRLFGDGKTAEED